MLPCGQLFDGIRGIICGDFTDMLPSILTDSDSNRCASQTSVDSRSIIGLEIAPFIEDIVGREQLFSCDDLRCSRIRHSDHSVVRFLPVLSCRKGCSDEEGNRTVDCHSRHLTGGHEGCIHQHVSWWIPRDDQLAGHSHVSASLGRHCSGRFDNGDVARNVTDRRVQLQQRDDCHVLSSRCASFNVTSMA